MGDRVSLSESDRDLIGRASSAEDVINALAARGCSDLTLSINSGTCGGLPIAGGGFCDVYQATLNSGTRIAIKSLRVFDRPGKDDEKEKILKRAARELYHWSKLQHPNVLQLMGLAVFRGHLSMISEWMENGSLMAYVRLHPDSNRISLCMDVCAGLCYIHKNEMVHGDLKAANVMVSIDGRALIGDFGNSQLRDLTLKFTDTTNSSVSVRWAAPELLAADAGPNPSKKADVYAYGMTALEILTGKVPYDGFNEQQILVFKLVSAKRRDPPRPTDISDELWELLLSCWIRKRTKRPTMKSIEERLRAFFPPSPPSSAEEETADYYSFKKPQWKDIQIEPTGRWLGVNNLARFQQELFPDAVAARRARLIAERDKTLRQMEARQRRAQEQAWFEEGQRLANEASRKQMEDERRRAEDRVRFDEKLRRAAQLQAEEERKLHALKHERARSQTYNPGQPSDDKKWYQGWFREKSRERSHDNRSGKGERVSGHEQPIEIKQSVNQSHTHETASGHEYLDKDHPSTIQNASQVAIAWQDYENAWADITEDNASKDKSTAYLTFYNIPWPIFGEANSFQDLTDQNITDFLLSPHHSHGQPPYMRLQTAMSVWLPKRFEQHVLPQVIDSHCPAVMAGVNTVARILQKELDG